MDFFVKKASALSSEEKTAAGISGIPANWPIETLPFEEGDIPENFEVMSEEDITTLKANNQASYDAWIASLRPTLSKDPQIVSVTSIQSIPAIGAKTVVIGGATKRLFARNTGVQQELDEGENTITFEISYPWIKVMGVEVIGGETGDYADLSVYDSATGTYSGVPNLKLNQFAYAVNIPKDYYKREAQFDADIYQGMIISITYNSQSAKTIGINLIMNEVKT